MLAGRVRCDGHRKVGIDAQNDFATRGGEFKPFTSALRVRQVSAQVRLMRQTVRTMRRAPCSYKRRRMGARSEAQARSEQRGVLLAVRSRQRVWVAGCWGGFIVMASVHLATESLDSFERMLDSLVGGECGDDISSLPLFADLAEPGHDAVYDAHRPTAPSFASWGSYGQQAQQITANLSMVPASARPPPLEEKQAKGPTQAQREYKQRLRAKKRTEVRVLQAKPHRPCNQQWRQRRRSSGASAAACIATSGTPGPARRCCLSRRTCNASWRSCRCCSSRTRR